MELLYQAQKAPQTSGVYIFKDRRGEILYIGRATSLRRRILNYFQKPIDRRISEMVAVARKIQFRKTKSVLEAVILEANLIKKYWPKYNIKDRDDRSFIYIIISKKEEYPRPLILRGRAIENLKLEIENYYLFGPYQSLSLVRSALKIIRRIFPYSTCCSGLSGRQGKPCFDYQIGLCPGLCIGAISKKDYQKNIKNLILFFKGERKRLIEKLKNENPDKIKALEHIQDAALIKDENFQFPISNFQKLHRIEGYDISHLAGKETYGSMAVFINAKPEKSQYRLFKIKEAAANNDLAALREVIVRRFRHKEWQFPDLILIDGGRPQVNHIEKTLKELSISIPLVGIAKYVGAAHNMGEFCPIKFGRDELIFSKNIKKSAREMIQLSKNALLRLRDEAHRFALKSSRRGRLKII